MNMQWQYCYKKHTSVSALKTNFGIGRQKYCTSRYTKINKHICSKTEKPEFCKTTILGPQLCGRRVAHAFAHQTCTSAAVTVTHVFLTNNLCQAHAVSSVREEKVTKYSPCMFHIYEL